VDLDRRVLAVIAGAVLGDRHLETEARDFLEAGLHGLFAEPVPAHTEIELPVRIITLGCHALAPSRQARLSAVFCPIRKITNSAGLSGATPIRQTMRPLSRSFCVMVVRSQRTKYASSGLLPSRWPLLNSLNRKSSTVLRTFDHSSGPFGSKTAHCV